MCIVIWGKRDEEKTRKMITIEWTPYRAAPSTGQTKPERIYTSGKTYAMHYQRHIAHEKDKFHINNDEYVVLSGVDYPLKPFEWISGTSNRCTNDNYLYSQFCGPPSNCILFFFSRTEFQPFDIRVSRNSHIGQKEQTEKKLPNHDYDLLVATRHCSYQHVNSCDLFIFQSSHYD